MRDYMDRRVTSPPWGPLAPCKKIPMAKASTFMFTPQAEVSLLHDSYGTYDVVRVACLSPG